MFKEMLSESNASSCMRFCVVLIIATACFNWIVGALAVIFWKAQGTGINATDIAAILGALGIKRWQKSLEKGNGGKDG